MIATLRPPSLAPPTTALLLARWLWRDGTTVSLGRWPRRSTRSNQAAAGYMDSTEAKRELLRGDVTITMRTPPLLRMVGLVEPVRCLIVPPEPYQRLVAAE